MIFPKHIDYLEEIIEKFIETKKDKINILTVSMPPRSGKTSFFIRKLPIWYLKKYKNNSVILSSYSQELLESNFKAVSPEKHIYNPFLISVGGAICGRSFDLFILDDYCKNYEESKSEVTQNRIFDWFKFSVYTHCDEGGIIIIAASRFNKNDLIGNIIKLHNKYKDDFNLVNINIPAIQNSESYWPERYSVKYLHELQNLIGNKMFNALYMGNPLE